MNLAWQHGRERIWIVNVGDIKPMEFPMEFFLTLAWDPQSGRRKGCRIHTIVAEREFGPAQAPAIAEIVSKYTKNNGRRKPELLEPGTFSLMDYQEADTVVTDWKIDYGKAEKSRRRCRRFRGTHFSS